MTAPSIGWGAKWDPRAWGGASQSGVQSLGSPHLSEPATKPPTSAASTPSGPPAGISYTPFYQQPPEQFNLGGLSFEQTPLVYWGLPALDEMMRSSGFYFADGRWWPKHPGMDYNVDAANRQFAGVRDVMEPELQRQLGQMSGSMSARGLGRSSIALGGESGLRGQYVTDLMRQRSSIIERERQRRWQNMLQILAGAQGQAGAAAAAARPDSGGGGWADWAMLMGQAAGSYYGVKAG